MKRLVLLIFSILTITGISAQTVDADAILNKTSQTYEEWGGAFVKFTAQIRMEMNGSTESFEGTIRMQDNKFVLTAPDMTTWFDGTTQWTYMERNEEVNIITPSNDDLRILNPMILLQEYKKDFNVAYIGESTTNHAKIASDLVFTPQKKSDIEKIEVQIEKNTSLPAKLVVRMRNQVLSVVINEIKADTPPVTFFTFPKASFPNVEIIDLR